MSLLNDTQQGKALFLFLILPGYCAPEVKRMPTVIEVKRIHFKAGDRGQHFIVKTLVVFD
jgi:hypothetical protein